MCYAAVHRPRSRTPSGQRTTHQLTSAHLHAPLLWRHFVVYWGHVHEIRRDCLLLRYECTHPQLATVLLLQCVRKRRSPTRGDIKNLPHFVPLDNRPGGWGITQICACT